MKIYRVDSNIVREYSYRKLSRWNNSTVLVGIVSSDVYRSLIPIIGDGGPQFEGEDNFEVVRYSEAELKAREEARRNRLAWGREFVAGKALFDGRDQFRLDEADFRLAVIPPSDDPRVLVNWRVFNCQKFEGTAEVLTEVPVPYTYRQDDGCYDVSLVNQLECLAIFKPGDTLRTVPIDPAGMRLSYHRSDYLEGYIYNMRWMTRGVEPFLSVRRRRALGRQRATA